MKKERKRDSEADESQLGLAARERGDHAAALTYFEAAARRRPDNVAAQIEVAKSLARLGQLDKAEACCRRVLQRKPKNAITLIVLGRIARQGNRHAEALANFEAAAAIEPQNIGAKTESARTLIKLERLAEAEKLCAEVLRLRPDFPQAAALLSEIARLTGAPARTQSIAAVVKEVPKTPEERVEAAQAFRREEHYRDAEALCRRSLKQYPGEVRIQHELAVNLRFQHKYQTALDWLKKVVAANPADVPIRLEMGFLYRILGRFDDAKVAYEGILKKKRGNAAALRGLAFIARQRSDLNQALALFKEATALQPNDPPTHLEIATLLAELLRFDEAEAALRSFEAFASAKDYVQYLPRRFQYFCTTTQWERAGECLQSWPNHADVPREAVANVAKYYAERGLWRNLMEFFHVRVIESRWIGTAQPTESVLEAISAAMRQTQRYEEVLSDLSRWPNKTTQAMADNLRDQIIEEMSLLRTMGKMEPAAGASETLTIADPFRARRHALVEGALSQNDSARGKAPRAKASRGSRRSKAVAHRENTVYFCTDAKYLAGATVSLFSLLRHNPSSLPHCTFVIYCPPEIIDFASVLLDDVAAFTGARIEARSTAGFFTEDMVFRTKWGAFTPGRGLSQAAYYRIFAAVQLMSEKQSRRALYIDADTCVGPGLADLLSFDLQGQPLAVRRERETNKGVQRAIVKLGMAAGSYFNSGVLLVDLAHPELEAALQRTIEVALNQHHLLTMVDQCALNLGFRELTATLPKECNFFIDDGEAVAPLPRQPIVTHFTAHPKPWDPWYRSEHCELWINEFVALRQAVPAERMRQLLGNFFPPRPA